MNMEDNPLKAEYFSKTFDQAKKIVIETKKSLAEKGNKLRIGIDKTSQLGKLYVIIETVINELVNEDKYGVLFEITLTEEPSEYLYFQTTLFRSDGPIYRKEDFVIKNENDFEKFLKYLNDIPEMFANALVADFNSILSD